MPAEHNPSGAETVTPPNQTAPANWLWSFSYLLNLNNTMTVGLIKPAVS